MLMKTSAGNSPSEKQNESPMEILKGAMPAERSTKRSLKSE